MNITWLSSFTNTSKKIKTSASKYIQTGPAAEFKIGKRVKSRSVNLSLESLKTKKEFLLLKSRTDQSILAEVNLL